jgi:hypothetical protein
VAALKKEAAKQSKEMEALKSHRPPSSELVAALEELRQQNRRSKVIFMKLRESEKKRREMGGLLREKGEALPDDDKFYGHSTLADINEIIQKSA